MHLVPRGAPFHTLARAIVGQQISVAAAQSVWNKFAGVALEIHPERILQLKPTQLRACGLSARKCEYISDLARRFADGAVPVHNWPGMDDEEVIEDLTQVRGIGHWTAEMFLMFNLLRPDVFRCRPGPPKGTAGRVPRRAEGLAEDHEEPRRDPAPLALGGDLVPVAVA